MRLALLDVGHGNCFIAVEGRTAAVFDVPPGRVAIDFLRRNSISSVREVVISHFDKDHSGGFVPLFSSGIRVDRLWFSDDQENRTIHYKNIARFLKQARMSGARVDRELANSDQAFELGRYKIELLSPLQEDRMLGGNRNRLSVMVRISRDNHGLVLLPGDLDLVGYQQLEDSDREYQADWLVVPHHGGLAGTGDAAVRLLRALLCRTKAKNVYFSFRRTVVRPDGTMPKGALPRTELTKLLRLEFPDVKIVCSQLSGFCADEHPLLGRSSFQEASSEGMQGSTITSCGGTVVLDAERDYKWEWEHAHDALVAEVGERALCGDQKISAPE